jgi:hypothetical protein
MVVMSSLHNHELFAELHSEDDLLGFASQLETSGKLFWEHLIEVAN